MILLIETATPVCSVALAEEGRILASKSCNEPNAHSSVLSVYINDIMGSVSLSDLAAVCVSSGPGSYTGLRIGTSTAKGLCYALRIPLLSVPTTQCMAAHYYRCHPDYNGMVCAMVDARRMECYAAIYNREGVVREVQADIVEPHCYDEFLDRGEVLFVGDGAPKTRQVLGVHPNARYDDSFVVSAEGMADIARQKLNDGSHEDLAYFEPFYLKEFVAKKSTVRGLV